MMFSGSPRHSGTRVCWDVDHRIHAVSRGGRSASTLSMLVRCSITSPTLSSRRSRMPPIMSRCSRSTLPSW